MSLSSCCHGMKTEINKPVCIRNERERLYLYFCCDWYHYGYTTLFVQKKGTKKQEMTKHFLFNEWRGMIQKPLEGSTTLMKIVKIQLHSQKVCWHPWCLKDLEICPRQGKVLTMIHIMSSCRHSNSSSKSEFTPHA